MLKYMCIKCTEHDMWSHVKRVVTAVDTYCRDDGHVNTVTSPGDTCRRRHWRSYYFVFVSVVGAG